MNAPEDREQRRLIYSGRVQGVGFRYTTARIARRHPVAGSVRNLPDGTVEVVVEGTPSAIQAFLAEVAKAFEGNISDCRSEAVDRPHGFETFEIRR
jgi:acylphosphatase